MRSNGDESLRDLERAVLSGDDRAALKLLAEWERRGLVPTLEEPIETSFTHPDFGQVSVIVTVPAPSEVQTNVEFEIDLPEIRRGIRSTGIRLKGVVLDADSIIEDYDHVTRRTDDRAVSAAVALGDQSRLTDILTIRGQPVNLDQIRWPGGPQDTSSFSIAVVATRDLLDAAPINPDELIRILLRQSLASALVTIHELRERLARKEIQAAKRVREVLSMDTRRR